MTTPRVQPVTDVDANQFGVSVTQRASTAIVHVVGELDLATAPILASALYELEAPYERVVLDLSGLTFMDSTGLRLTVTEHQRSTADGFDLVVAGATGDVLKLLRLTGLDGKLPMAANLAAALGDGDNRGASDADA
jgi:anti-sigma B factor antagonist